MKKLFIFTDEFPYGKGEKTFLLPELDVLRSHHDVIIVSMATDEMVRDARNETPLPEGVRLVRGRKLSLGRLLRGCLRMPFSKEGRQELVRIRRATPSKLLRLRRGLESVKQYGYAWNLMKRYEELGLFQDVDDSLYYSFWLNHCNLALTLKKGTMSQMALISRVHGYDLYDQRAPWSRQAFQWLKIERTDKVICAARSALDHLAEKHRMRASAIEEKLVLSRIGSSPYGCDQPDKRPGTGPLVVSCSNAIPLKRVELIIETLALLPDENITWVHFGAGQSLEKLKALACAHKVNARFEGFVSNEDIRGFYRNHWIDAFITTSSTEGGCPVSITEALAFGIPIIGTAVGGIPEQIDGNGILLPPDPSPEEAARALQELIHMPEADVHRLRARSQEIFAERFSPQANLPALEEAFRSVSQSHHSAKL